MRDVWVEAAGEGWGDEVVWDRLSTEPARGNSSPGEWQQGEVITDGREHASVGQVLHCTAKCEIPSRSTQSSAQREPASSSKPKEAGESGVFPLKWGGSHLFSSPSALTCCCFPLCTWRYGIAANPRLQSTNAHA